MSDETKKRAIAAVVCAAIGALGAWLASPIWAALFGATFALGVTSIGDADRP